MPNRLTFLFVLLTCAITCAATCVAQQDPDLKTPLVEDKLTTDALKARVAKITALKGLDKEKQARLLNTYGEAQKDLEAAAALRRKIKPLQELRTNGTVLKTLQARLQQTLPAVAEAQFQDLDKGKLTAELARARAAEKHAGETLKSIDKESGDQKTRLVDLPKELTAAEKRVKQMEAEVTSAAATKDEPMVAAALVTSAHARLRVAQLTHTHLQLELDTSGLVAERRALQSELARRDQKHAEARIRVLLAVIQKKDQADAEAARSEAAERARNLKSAVPMLARAAADSAEFARKRLDLNGRLPGLRADIERTKQQQTAIAKNLDRTRRMIDTVGLTQKNGELLRRQRSRLPRIGHHYSERRRDATLAAELRIQQFTVEEVLELDEAVFVQQVVDSRKTTRTGQETPELPETAREVFRELRNNANKLRQEQDEVLAELQRLETERSKLIQTVSEFGAFIEEKILWVASAPPLWSPDWGEARKHATALLPSPQRAVEALRAGFFAAWTWVIAGLLVAAVLTFFRNRLRRLMKSWGEAAAQPIASRFTPAILSAIASLLIALPIPILLLVFWAVLRTNEAVSAASWGPAQACFIAAMFLVAVEFARQLCRPYGLCEAHFGWGSAGSNRLKRTFFGLAALGTPLLFLTAYYDVGTSPYHDFARAHVGRIAFVAGMLLLMVQLGLLFHPTRGVLAPSATNYRIGLRRGSRTTIYLFAIGLPLLLTVLAIVGYYYSAKHLAVRFLATIGMLFGLLIVNGLISRWQMITRRRLAIEQRRQQLEAARAAREKAAAEAAADAAAEAKATPDEEAAGGAGARSEGSTVGTASPETARPEGDSEEEQLNVAEVSAQARQLTRSALVLVGLVGVFGIWADVLPAFGALREVPLWNTTLTVTEDLKGATEATRTYDKVVPITLADLLGSLIAVVMMVVAAKNLPGFLRLSFLQRFRPGNQYAIATITQYLIVVLGIVIAFNFIGIGWSKVQWLVAAVSLGLGFGLQEIFANFVSGLIILFEQPIRVGDFVTVGNTSGEVTRIRIRATTVRNLERRELIVPNRQFITGEVVNWTLTDTINRITVVVGVAYGSNVDLAREILLRVANENPHVVAEPKPKAIFRQFGDSSLNFELRVFIRDMDHWPRVIDGIHSAIDREFRKAKIEIAFPQRDLHLRTVSGPVPLQMDQQEARSRRPDVS